MEKTAHKLPGSNKPCSPECFAPLGKFARSFSLIEVLIVIALIAIISTILFFTINPLKRIAQSRDVKRKNDLAVLQTALESSTFENPNHYYPACNTRPDWYACYFNNITPLLNPGQIKNLPKDPVTNGDYIYYSWEMKDGVFEYCSSSGKCTNYSIIICLDDKDDPDPRKISYPETFCPSGYALYQRYP